MSHSIFSDDKQKGVYFDKCFKSYYDIKQSVNDISKFLEYYLSDEQKMVGVYIQNSIEYIQAYFSVLALHKVVVPIYRKIHAKEEMLRELDICDVYTVITNCESYEFLCDLLESSKRRITIINVTTREVCSFNQCTDIIISDVPKSLSVLLQSSGSSNSPKKIMHSLDNLLLNAELHIKAAHLRENERTLIELPMTFSYCNTAQLLAHICLNADIYISSNFSSDTFVSQVINNKITNTTLVPSQLVSLSMYPGLTRLNSSCLKKVFYGGSFLNESVLLTLLHKCPNIDFINTYGQTETGPRMTLNLENSEFRKLGSVGKPLSGINIEIRDKIDDKIGTVFAKTPCLMLGYYKNVPLTESVVQNGWINTGDMGYFDEDGYLYLTGRIKNIIISGGINIYPEEIEAVLESHQYVNKAYVYGVPNPILGEIPYAQIECNNDKMQISDIYDYCKDKLSNYKTPYKIYIVDKISTTINGKLKRF